MLANLRALLGVVVDIILLRRGPEHLPASTVLLALTVGLYLAVVGLVNLSTAGFGARHMFAIALGVGASLVWYYGALSMVKKRERFVQLATGLIAVSTVFTPLLEPMKMNLLQQVEGKQSPTQLFVLLMLSLVAWAITVYVRMVRAAFEWPWPAALLLIIGQEVFALVIIYMFIGAPPAAA
jgi:hypothetical protein